MSFIFVFIFIFSNAQDITSFTLIDSGAGLVSYPSLGNYFSYSKIESDSFFDIYTRNLNGTNPYCWTCPTFLTRNNAHPEWHPSMKYIVFQGEKVSNTLWTHPGFGWYFDLWILRVSDSTYYNIRDAQSANPTSTLTGVLHPHFSHDGRKLIWAELHGSFIDWQNYSLMIADFDTFPVPNISNIQTMFDPQYGLIEPQGFSNKDDKIVFAGNLDSAQKSTTLDIYYLQLDSNFNLLNPIPIPVSKSDSEWAEAAKFTPDDSSIIFSTTKTFPIYPDSANPFQWKKSEYWIVNVDGTNPRRISFFMDTDSAEYFSNHVDAADFDISPDGSELIATLSANNNIYVVKLGLTLSATNGISPVPENKNELHFYPNPSNGMIYIQSFPNEQLNKILIFDLTGSKVAGYNFSNQINISQLNKGIYFLRISDKTGNFEKNGKVIIH